MITINEEGILTKSNCKLPDFPEDIDNTIGTFFPLESSEIICGGGYPTTTKCYKWESSTFSWKSFPPMTRTRMWHGMTSTYDKIFVCGGHAILGEDFLSSCEMFDGSWKPIKPLPLRLSSHCMISPSNETILSIGGYHDGKKFGVSKSIKNI